MLLGIDRRTGKYMNMKLSEIRIICFSPTGTSAKIATDVAEGVGNVPVVKTDLTRETGEWSVSGDALAVIAVPVYGGKVAPLALKRMERIKGEDTPAVLIVVYGNRAYGEALNELDVWAVAHGFKPIAAGTFVGEHSYSTSEFPIAQGRPNEQDMAYARVFGEKIRRKIESGVELAAVDVKRIARPKQSLLSLIRFIVAVMKWRKQQVPMQRSPKVDPERCVQCGACAAVCPVEIIASDGKTLTEEGCIKCCACVKRCPHQARSFDTPFRQLLWKNFKKAKMPQTIL